MFLGLKTHVEKDLFLFPPRQKPEKLSVGSMLLVVSLMAVGACVTSLAFGKLSVSIISRILSSIPRNLSGFLGLSTFSGFSDLSSSTNPTGRGGHKEW